MSNIYIYVFINHPNRQDTSGHHKLVTPKCNPLEMQQMLFPIESWFCDRFFSLECANTQLQDCEVAKCLDPDFLDRIWAS